MMHNIYQEILMDHYKNPRNRGHVSHYSFIAEQRNSSCGDEIVCSGIIAHDILQDIRFEGKGCVISQATASLLSERVKGRSVQDICLINKDDLSTMIGMQLGPVRMQCALLSLIALSDGINKHKRAQ